MTNVICLVLLCVGVVWLMGQSGGCMDVQPASGHSPGGAFYDPPAGATGRPVTQPGHWVAVSWSKPNGYMPAPAERSCRQGYMGANYNNRLLCVTCPSGTSLRYVDNDYYCASCPPGHTYTMYQGRPYCFRPS